MSEHDTFASALREIGGRYKVWNGHAIQLRTQVDDMPAFQGKLTRDQVWDIVEHLKVLRTPVR